MAESWITSYCSLIGHEYFAEVSEDFIEDDFNLTGLAAQVPMYKDALEMILDVEPEDDEDDDEDDIDEDEEEDLNEDEKQYRRASRRHARMASDISMIESSAELLYGLIHQRYITSRPGIQQMLEKYELGHFGHCPRVYCNGAKVLPVGCSDTPGQETVKLFCPSCLDIYTPPNSRFQTVDGAFFGTTFGCLFFMTFPELDTGIPKSTAAASALLQLHQQQAMAQQQEASNTANGVELVPASRTTSSSSTQLAPTSSATSRPPHATTTASLNTMPLPPQPTSINGMPTPNLAPGLGAGNIYEPRIYGFRVSERARTGPRMQWLRSKPADINELDEVRIYEAETTGADVGIVAGQQEGDGELGDGVGLDRDEAMPDAAKVNGRTAEPTTAATKIVPEGGG